jgi:hypothetical protein
MVSHLGDKECLSNSAAFPTALAGEDVHSGLLQRLEGASESEKADILGKRSGTQVVRDGCAEGKHRLRA